MVRIYQSGEFLPDQRVQLTEEAGQHVGVVLRMQPGQPLILFTGDNKEYNSTIVEVHKKKVEVQVNHIIEINRESPRNIHLAQAISKGEKMEWLVQKAVELGVSSFTPLLTTRCMIKLDEARLAKKQAQWQAIAIAACEQSGRNILPIIYPVCQFEDYITAVGARNKFILYPQANKSWRNYIGIEGDIALLIGPEGGLHEAEVNAAMHVHFQPLNLGPRILRTETAAIAALSMLQAVMGDL